MRQQDARDRQSEKERFVRRLDWLSGCCKPADSSWPPTRWPDRVFLRSLEEHVMLLITTERKNRPLPAWKAFLLLDKRMPSLRLVLRVNNLVKHARERLEEARQFPMERLERQAERGDESARKLLRDIALIRDSKKAAKRIDWTQHEKALSQFSPTRSVEPAYCRSAPLEARCYARALELIVDDYRRKPLRDNCLPLIQWAAQIGHPKAKSLCAFDHVAAWIVEQEEGVWRGKSALRRREKVRERVRRHREWVNGAWVYAGAWLRHSREKPLPAWAKANPNANCELCGKRVGAAEHWYIQRTDHQRVRCSDCQSVIWQLDGYDYDPPFGDLKKPDLKHDAARYAEAISEVLGEKYIPKRIKEILAADQTKAD